MVSVPSPPGGDSPVCAWEWIAHRFCARRGDPTTALVSHSAAQPAGDTATAEVGAFGSPPQGLARRLPRVQRSLRFRQGRKLHSELVEIGIVFGRVVIELAHLRTETLH